MPEIRFNFIMSDTLYDLVDGLDKSTTRFRQSLDNAFWGADADVLADLVIQTLYERVCKTCTNMGRYSLHWRRVLSDAKTLYRRGEDEIKIRAEALDKSFIFRTGMGAKSDVFYSKVSYWSTANGSLRAH